MAYTTEWTKEQERELNQLLGRPDNWQEIATQKLTAQGKSFPTTQIDKSFDHPVVSNKVNRNNFTVNDKYIFLIKITYVVYLILSIFFCFGFLNVIL